MSLSAAASLPPLLISTKQLASLLTSSTRPLRVLDATWYLNMPDQPKRDGRTDFLKGPRVPGSLFWDVEAVATRGDAVMNLPHMMPTSQVFADAAKQHGISRDTHVVVYDRQGIFSAPRTAFTFAAFGHPAISVLDGGLPAWIAAGEGVDSEALSDEPAVEPVSYDLPELKDGWVRSFDEMLHNTKLGAQAQLVLDARPKPRFDGTSPEPRPDIPGGHIPHSLSLPFSAVLDTQKNGDSTYTTFKSQIDLWKAVTNAVGEENVEKLRHDASARDSLGVSLSCGSGMTACILWLALQQLGIRGALYDESWLGWGRRAGNGQAPVEK